VALIGQLECDVIYKRICDGGGCSCLSVLLSVWNICWKSSAEEYIC
jgi:hypothetical protein